MEADDVVDALGQVNDTLKMILTQLELLERVLKNIENNTRR